jgi:integrase
MICKIFHGNCPSTKRKPPLLRFNPVADYRLPDSDDEVIMPPTVEEVEAIYEAAADHLKRAIMLSWYLGLRPGAVELLSLTWSNVSLEVGIIRIMSAHKGGPRMRDVPINRALRIQLEEWKKRDGGRGHLIRYHGKPLSKIHGAWKSALERAGIKRRLRPYDLRHHFATRALESGADIGALSEIMGSLPETLRRHYQHVSRELTRRTVELIPELEIAGTTRACCIKDAPANPRKSKARKRT